MTDPQKSIDLQLSGKPKIEPVERSNLVTRLKTFFPQIEEANKNLSKDGEDGHDIEIVEDLEESSDSDSSDSSDDDQCDTSEESEITDEVSKSHVEIDLDVFVEANTFVDQKDVSVHEVETLPKAFRSQHDAKTEEKKNLIEELK
ncbi:unnamed protein product [Caenorhabditis bovis]|uniref:Uncharacterized protein n=1 Tax=Caenorhabditis bovis TaxID=2654633 RepID=A0A8S1F1D1_9PELO|nr:unnamed protein product [Caenorhabditis bovis]